MVTPRLWTASCINRDVHTVPLTVREQLQTAWQTAAADLTAAAHLFDNQSADKRERRVRCLRVLRPYLGSYYWQLFKSYITAQCRGAEQCRVVTVSRDTALLSRTLTGRLSQWRIFKPYQMSLKQRRWCSNERVNSPRLSLSFSRGPLMWLSRLTAATSTNHVPVNRAR